MEGKFRLRFAQESECSTLKFAHDVGATPRGQRLTPRGAGEALAKI